MPTFRKFSRDGWPAILDSESNTAFVLVAETDWVEINSGDLVTERGSVEVSEAEFGDFFDEKDPPPFPSDI